MPYAKDFEEWYLIYPRHQAKKDAAKAFEQTREEHPPDLLEQTRLFAEYHRREGTNQRWIPLPATWLRGWRWEDELDLPKLQSEMSNSERWSAGIRAVEN